MPETLGKKAWTRHTLADCCKEIAQRIDNLAESGYERFVGLEHMETGETSIRNWGGTEEVTSSMKLFKTGDVIVARRNVYLRRAALAGFDGVCSGDGIVLRGNSTVCLPGLLPFILNTNSFWDYVTSQADGTMSKRITVKRLLSYEFALPPLEEQRRIVEVLLASQRARTALDMLAAQSEALLEAWIASRLSGVSTSIPLGNCLLSTEYGCSKRANTDGNGVPILRIPNVLRDDLDLVLLR